VARVSHVSVATVSRVFNDHPRVSDPTRRRVLAAASRLGYWPNGVARSLITNRTNTLGLLVPELHGEFFSEVIHGVDVAARERGKHLLLSRTSSGEEELGAALRAMRGRVDGLIVMAPDFDACPTIVRESAGLPTLLLAPGALPHGCDSISVANRQGALALTRHLIALGHRSIAMITGPMRNIEARERREGWRAALREAGVNGRPPLEMTGDFSEHSGYDAMVALLQGNPRPRAVFAANDYMAAGALGALQDAGLRVPDDVALAGFDDIPLARYLTPPLTTVHVDRMRLGRSAVERVLEPHEAGAPERHEVLPVTLVVRASCGAAQSGAGAARAHRTLGRRVSPPRR
jgi:LacI family transcriptional regulator, galactose operon repressor